MDGKFAQRIDFQTYFNEYARAFLSFLSSGLFIFLRYPGEWKISTDTGDWQRIAGDKIGTALFDEPMM